MARRGPDDASRRYVVALSVQCAPCGATNELSITPTPKAGIMRCSKCGEPLRGDRADLARVITKIDPQPLPVDD